MVIRTNMKNTVDNPYNEIIMYYGKVLVKCSVERERCGSIGVFRAYRYMNNF